MSETLITLLIVAAAVGGIVVYVLNYKPRRKSKVRDLYAEGLDMLITGRRRAAYQNFKEIIQKDTDNIKAYLRLGQVIREGGNPQQALKIHKSLTLRNNLTHYEQIELRKNLALDYHHAGSLESAIEELHSLLKLEKSNDWGVSHLIKFYREQQNWTKAGEYFELHQKITEKPEPRKQALFKIQEGRILIKKKKFAEARRMFEAALNIENGLAVAYYFIGNSYSEESEQAYQKSVDQENRGNGEGASPQQFMTEAKELLAKAVPMWIRYAELKPGQAWLVIQLLKDALFTLDRYPEFENILKQILGNDSDNIEVIASLADIYAHRGETDEAIELIDRALDKDPKSLIVKLNKIKLQARRESSGSAFTRELDEIIHFLVTDERFQVYKETARDSDIMWLYDTSGEIENIKR